MLNPSTAKAPSLLLFDSGSSSSVANPTTLWRHDACPADCQRPILALSWTLAVSLACLAVGLIGLSSPIVQPIQLLEMASAPQGHDSGEIAMFEMTAPPSEENTAPSESALAIALPEPETLPELLPQPLENLPEIAEVMTAEDLFEVPAAAPVEPLLKPETPRTKESPPTNQPQRSSSASSPSTASRSASSGASSSVGAAGGTGGAGTSSRGTSKGYFPAPPYPAAARSRGMQGTVYLSITFGADGRVTGATVSRSSGYSDLDSAASSWVRRNWRAPVGQVGTFRQPVQFRLR